MINTPDPTTSDPAPIPLTPITDAGAAATQLGATVTTSGMTISSRSMDDTNTTFAVRVTHTCGWYYEISTVEGLAGAEAAANAHTGV